MIPIRSNAQESVYLEKGKSSPYDGYLLPESKVKELRNNTLDLQSYKSQTESLQKSLELQDKKIEILAKHNNDLTNTVMEEQKLSTWTKIGYFTLGLVITGLSVKLSHEIYK